MPTEPNKALERDLLDLNRRGFPKERESDSRCWLGLEASTLAQWRHGLPLPPEEIDKALTTVRDVGLLSGEP
jgi:hypothetical protein